MSLAPFSQRSISKNEWANTQGALTAPLPVAPNQYGTWIRNPSWLPLTAPSTSESKGVALFAVFPEGNFVCVRGRTNYTVDWGDGSPLENYNDNVTAYHQYSFSNALFDGTNAPVTFQGGADTVTRNSHGYQNGYQITFASITTTTGIIPDQIYYVVNATTDTFQLSLSSDGSPIDLVGDGTGFILPYKQAIITVTPQAGQILQDFILGDKHNQSGLSNYINNFLDVAVSSANLLSFSTQSSQRSPLIERIRVIRFGGTTLTISALSGLRRVEIAGNGTSTYNLSFDSCVRLIEVILNNIPKVSSLGFNNCYSLETAPFVDTSACTSFANLFRWCVNLKNVPCYDATNVTNIQSMFEACHCLEQIPYFNFSNVTNAFNFCINAFSLKSIPAFDFSKVTSMSGTFSNCRSLRAVPKIKTTSACTNFTNTFANCSSLKYVEVFDTSGATTMASMFVNCYSLVTAPSLNTSLVQNFSSMFAFCHSLANVPFYNTSSATNVAAMFEYCYSLSSIPSFNLSNVTNFSAFMKDAVSLRSFPIWNTQAATTMANMLQTSNNIPILPKLNTSNVTSLSNFNIGPTSYQIFPAWDLSACTVFSNAFASASYTQFFATGMRYTFSISGNPLSKGALETVFNNCGTIASSPQTLTISGCYGAPTPVSLSGTTTAGSTTITMANTTGITAGMQVTGIGTPLTTPIAVTFQDSGDTVTLVAHGLSNDDEVSFAAITSTTGIIINKIYYVVNAAADTFQVSDTLGGAALPLTTDGSGTLRYRAEVVSVVPNTSITISRPATSSGTNTLAFQTLRTGTALLKGWTVSQ